MAELVGHCETCGVKIFAGASCHYTADGCWLCEEHSPMLSDAIRQHQEIADAPHFDPGALDYDSRDDLLGQLERLRRDLAEKGDRKLLVTA